MTNGFAQFIPKSRAFLAKLSRNNSRDWYGEHKAQYDKDLKTPALLLLDQIAHDLNKQTGDDIDTKLFRPHRDLRYSKDKTPYTTHLHMLWTQRGRGSQDIGYFFGISPNYVSAGAGLMAFDKSILTDWRAAIDGRLGDQIKQAIATAQELGATIRQPDLKRVPAPHSPDHRHADLIRRKGLSLWRELDEADYGDPVSALHQAFDQVYPVTKLLKTLL
jgi:uncharacterized protein (TIGR02453 family)